jgi:hypothetical protein
MFSKIRTFPSHRTIILALICTAALSGGYLVGYAAGGQPHMHAALEQLRAARSELKTAESDKGGHRVKAIALVNDAIAEVEAGMDVAR